MLYLEVYARGKGLEAQEEVFKYLLRKIIDFITNILCIREEMEQGGKWTTFKFDFKEVLQFSQNFETV